MRSAECGMQSRATGRRATAFPSFGSSVLWFFASLVLCLFMLAAAGAQEKAPAFTLDTLRGRVVFLAEAMEERTGAASVPEAKERVLALQTQGGELIPLLEDVRARAFRRDQRLRELQVELLVRRYRGWPLAQIIRVFAVRADGLYEVDYWCEVCSIVMFEQKDCECCQEPNELRLRKIEH
jgi:hypothetical protein